MAIQSYSKALEFIEHEIPQNTNAYEDAPAKLNRAKRFLHQLGEPQNKFKSIHIAGTSGKGSTAMMLYAILVAHDKRVGVTLSPHVYDIRERCQIGGRLISQAEFVTSLNEILPAIYKLPSPPSYFETLLALALVTFARQKVDYAIIETGMGGKFDATNLITRSDKLCILTSMGIDHTEALGNSISEITMQKAGIIMPGTDVITYKQSLPIMRVFKQVAAEKKANLIVYNVSLSSANRSLAMVAANHLAKPDNWALNKTIAAKALNNIHMPGRFEIIDTRKKTFVFDGAHNQQKLDYLHKLQVDLFKIKPVGMIFSMRESKAIPRISGVTKLLTTTGGENQDMSFLPYSPEQLAKKMKRKNPKIDIEAIDSMAQAVKKALASNIDIWLITGSFFILAEAKQALRKAGK